MLIPNFLNIVLFLEFYSFFPYLASINTPFFLLVLLLSTSLGSNVFHPFLKIKFSLGDSSRSPGC